MDISLKSIYTQLFIPDSFLNSNDPLYETKNTHENIYENVYFGISVEKPDGWFSNKSDKQNFFLLIVSDSAISQNKNISDHNVEMEMNTLKSLFAFTANQYG